MGEARGGAGPQPGHPIIQPSNHPLSLSQARLRRIYAPTVPANLASSHVLEKLNFQFEGCLRRHLKLRGRYQDLEFWGLLKGER